jgi:hopanoid biosynthesis associated RND transporter like protein HpnN
MIGGVFSFALQEPHRSPTIRRLVRRAWRRAVPMKPEQPPSDSPTTVQRLLVGLVAAVCRFPAVVLLTAALLCGLAAYASLTRLAYFTQRDDLLSPNKDYQKRWRQYLAEFGDDDDIVVVVRGRDRRQMRDALEALANQARAQPARFDRLFYKVDLRALGDRALLYLPAAQIRQIQENIRRMGLLLDPPVIGRIDPLFGWKSLTLVRLLSEARSVAGRLDRGRPPPPEADQFLTQLGAITRAALVSLESPADYKNPWLSLMAQPSEQENLLAEPQYFFSGEKEGASTLAFLLVRPVKEQGSFTACQKSVAALRAIVAAVAPRFPGLQVGLTGLPVLESDEMAASEKDTHVASYLALAGVALLFLVVYRGWRNPFLTVTTLLVGTVWAMGWTTLTVGHLNILSATFAVMLIGMGDYGVLWVTRYEQNRAAGADVLTALRQTAAGGGPSILTAALATAIAFCAAMLADFRAVAELGWIAGSGVLFCALSCFTVLPAMLCLFDRRSAASARQGLPPIIPLAAVPRRAAGSWLPALAGRPRWVIGTSLAVTAVLGLFAFRVRYDHNLLHMQARGLDSVKWEMTLIRHTDGANWHALSWTTTPEEALALRARYEKLGEVSRVVEVASLVPQGQDEKLGLLGDIRHRLRNLPARGTTIPHVPPALGDLKAELNTLIDRLQSSADVSAAPCAELYQDLVRLRAKLLAKNGALVAGRLQQFEQRLTRDLADDLHRLRDVSTPVPITLADLPPSLRERYIGKNGKWLLRVFARNCLWDYRPLEQFVDRVRTVDPEATGKPFGTLEGLRSLKNGFQLAGLYALLAIVAVFWTDFRNLGHTLGALTPLAMGVVISLGIMGLFGLPLNPANMIAFPLILGVGAVYGVHVVHDYLVRGPRRRYTLSHIIGRAVLVMALTNMISFGTLTLSRHRGLSGLGFTLMLGVGCCMLTALVFLPAVLRFLSERPGAAAPPAQEPKKAAA